jgi:hypothetical protein
MAFLAANETFDTTGGKSLDFGRFKTGNSNNKSHASSASGGVTHIMFEDGTTTTTEVRFECRATII